MTSADHEALEHLARDLDGEISEAEPVGWGDAAATTRVTLVDGRRFAARRLFGPNALRRADQMVGVFAAMGRSRLPIPDRAASWAVEPGDAWIVTTWVDGTLGASCLDDPASAVRLATAMGALIPRLARVDPAGLTLDQTWAAGDALSAASDRWVAALDDDVEDPLRRSIDEAVRVTVAAAEHADWAPGFAHGDFAPVNVILGADGSTLALLDVETARIAPSLFDVAWWGWIVRYHHPAAWAAAWPAFLGAAGLSPAPRTDTTINAIQVLQAVERAAATTDLPTKGRWIVRATAIASWPR